MVKIIIIKISGLFYGFKSFKSNIKGRQVWINLFG